MLKAKEADMKKSGSSLQIRKECALRVLQTLYLCPTTKNGRVEASSGMTVGDESLGGNQDGKGHEVELS